MTFMGYPRNDGTAGTRNLVAVLPLVFCANHVAQRIAASVRGAVAFPHPVGCGYPGPDQDVAAHILKRLAFHPNFGAVLVVGLGCERVRLEDLDPDALEKQKPLRSLSIQAEGDSCRAMARGIALAQELVNGISSQQRQPCPLSALRLGLKCGGTDAFSGLAANPVLGRASDLLLERGGASLLTEVTELCGTEAIMKRRAASPEVAARIGACVERNVRRLSRATRATRGTGPTKGAWKDNGHVMLVSPGNADGGVSNVVEKALGGLKKAGNAPFEDVLDYGCPPPAGGLYLMDGPGHDGEAVTGLVAAGANLVAFTTGRGTPAGFPGVPVVKITGNPDLYQRMTANLDFDAGALIRGERALEELGADLFEKLVQVASGAPVQAELLGHEELFCVSRFMATHQCCECGEPGAPAPGFDGGEAP